MSIAFLPHHLLPYCWQDPKVTADRDFNGFGTNFENSPEPIYGSHFLPRKFKVGVTVPGDNSIDLFTNDLGIVVICNEAGELQGYNILVGGGMGRAHRFETWFSGAGLQPCYYTELACFFKALSELRWPLQVTVCLMLFADLAFLSNAHLQ